MNEDRRPLVQERTDASRFVRRVRDFAARHALWHPDTRVVVALSGGADSVSLLLLLHELDHAGDLRLDCAAHLNHQLRPEANLDEQFCRALCASLNVDCLTERVDVGAVASRNRLSIEVAARQVRHAFFEDVRRRRGAEVVATAHSEDDQAETVLLRIVRGTGRRGLAGIRPRRAHLVRPLLGIGRQELREFLRQRGQPWREDESNAALTTPRNRIRAELLPYLATHFNPAVTRALARLADVAREDNAWIETAVSEMADRLIERRDEGLTLDVTGFATLPEGLARRVAQRALEQANPGRSFTVREVDRLRAVAGGSRTVAEISGLRVERFRDSEVLIKRAPAGRLRRRGTGV